MDGSPFPDRAEAGRQIAQHLQHYARHPSVRVLGLPRGGISVAYEVAQALSVPLDVYLVRKLGVPQQPELAMGAIASGGVRHLNTHVIQDCQIDAATLEQVTQQEWQELQRRDRRYHQGRPPPDIDGNIIILVDDGMATGATLLAALKSLRHYHLVKLVVAIPVAPPESYQNLNTLADEVVCLITPKSFHSVGQWYVDFDQVSDEEVCHLLRLESKSE